MDKRQLTVTVNGEACDGSVVGGYIDNYADCDSCRVVVPNIFLVIQSTSLGFNFSYLYSS